MCLKRVKGYNPDVSIIVKMSHPDVQCSGLINKSCERYLTSVLQPIIDYN